MEKSYLIQRVRRPSDGRRNPFAFGGGYRNGGLSEEAASIMDKVLVWDYMGAAEFEFGELPKGLQRMAKMAEAGEMTLFSITIGEKTPETQGTEVFPASSPARMHQILNTIEQEMVEKRVEPQPTDTVYVFCRATDKGEVEERIRQLAVDEPSMRLKEQTRLVDALAGKTNVAGWLELDNGFFFTVDKTMAEGFAAIFAEEE